MYRKKKPIAMEWHLLDVSGGPLFKLTAENISICMYFRSYESTF